MTSIISSFYERLFPKTEYRCFFLGLDSSGKTTILYQMILGEKVTTIPTIGLNLETIECCKANIKMWDIGGCDKIGPLIRHYYNNMKGLVFVIDSTDIK